MPHYVHTFRCIRCDGRLGYRNKSDDDGEGVPSLFHDELAKYLVDSRNSNPEPELTPCNGRLLYHSTAMITLAVRAAAPVDAEWLAFETVVKAAWRAFKASGFKRALRGPNTDRSYKMPAAVAARLASAKGKVMIGNVCYDVAPSLTTDVALHRQLTEAQGAEGSYKSFIFHL